MTDLRQPIKLHGDVNQLNRVNTQSGTKEIAERNACEMTTQVESLITKIIQNLLVANYAADNELEKSS